MRRAIATLSVPALLAAAAFAGPLNPPSGPVQSTTKTLTEVEPRIAINATNTPGDADSMFRITSPGSYYLADNLTAIPGKAGIEIVADDVTIDLGGFRIGGYPGALDGINTGGTTRRNITVFGGGVWTMSGMGINLYTAAAASLHDVTVRDCGGVGVRVGAASRLRSVDSSGNQFGISAGANCMLESCSVTSNLTTGISAGTNCTLSDCVAASNGAIGIAITSGVIRGCSSRSNASRGYYSGEAAVFTDSNAMLNGEGGFYAGTGSTVDSCTAYLNTGPGIKTEIAVMVTNCTVRENTAEGIRLLSGCTARGNICSINGTAGGANIRAQQSENRIEDNTCSGAPTGILAEASRNIIVRNTCASNTLNWSLVAGNIFGTIVDRTSPGSAAVSGNSAASSLGTTDANANFSY